MRWVRVTCLMIAALLAGCDAPPVFRGACGGEDLKSAVLYADCSRDGQGVMLRTGPAKVSLLARVKRYSVTGDFDDPLLGLRPDFLFYPVSAPALVNRAVARLLAGYYPGAIEDLDAALNFNPVATDAFYARGRIYLLIGRPRQALADLNEAWRLTGGRTDIAYHRANANRQIGRWRAALLDYDFVLKRQPLHTGAAINRGAVRQIAGFAREALADYNRALKQQPDSREARYNRALAHAQQGDHDAALADLDELVRRYPLDLDLIRSRARLHASAGDAAAAQRDYEHILAVFPDDANALTGRAGCAPRQGNSGRPGPISTMPFGCSRPMRTPCWRAARSIWPRAALRTPWPIWTPLSLTARIAPRPIRRAPPSIAGWGKKPKPRPMISRRPGCWPGMAKFIRPLEISRLWG